MFLCQAVLSEVWSVYETAAVARAYLSESGFSGFHLAQLALLDITGNPAKTNMDERLRVKDEPVES